MARRSLLLVLVLFLIASSWPQPVPVAAAGTPLYPDLKTTNPSGLWFDRATIDGSSHYVLRFNNTVWNAGEGRMELQGDPNPSGSNKIYQNIYDATSGGTRVLQRQVSADILYHPSHYHYHFEGFASYLLLQRDASGVYQPTTKKGTKTGFCIMDVTRITSTGPSGGQYWECGGTFQGLSVGWGDTYESTLPDQWIDLGTTQLADGYYAVQSIADPYNKLLEGGRDDNNVAITYFRVSSGVISTQAAPTTASCGITPASGSSGTPVTITCSEFGARETVNVYWNTTASMPIATTTAEKSGRAVFSFQIPQAATGSHTLIVKGSSTRRQDTVGFSLRNPVPIDIWVSPAAGNVGDYPTVYGSNFAPGEQVRLYWDSTATTPLRTVTASSTGGLSRGFTVPPSAAGDHTLIAVGVTSGREGRATFTVYGTPAARLSLSASSGYVGDYPAVYGSNFAPGEQVRLYWDSTATTPLRTVTASSTGTFSRGITVPPATPGVHTIVAVGVTSGREGRVTFTVVDDAPTTTTTSLSRTSVEPKSSKVAASATPTLPDESLPSGTPAASPTAEPTGTPMATPTIEVTEVATPTVAPIETTEPIITPEPSVAPAEPVAIGTVADTGGEALACRTEPATGAIIGQLAPGASVMITGDAVDGWYPVLCDGIAGWVSADYVVLGDEPAAPTEVVVEEPTPTLVVEPTVVDEPVEVVPDPTIAAPVIEEPTAEPQPVITVREQTITVTADSSVTRDGASNEPERLSIGGPDEAIAVVSFEVNGIEGGTVVGATLVLTGAVSGPAGNVIALPGTWVDEQSASWSLAENGTWVGQVDWVTEGGPTYLDVTGMVTGDGVVTFVLTGNQEQLAAIGSREGGIPAYLELVIEELE